MQHFSLFGLDVNFALDTQELKHLYHKLITETQEQDLAPIHLAYSTLVCPVERACYMLLSEDVDIKSESITVQDNDFLMVQFEKREELATAQSEQELENIERWAKTHLEKYTQEFMQALSTEQRANWARKMLFIKKFERDIGLRFNELD